YFAVSTVMAGHSRSKNGVASARLCPAIHVFSPQESKTWMPAPGMTSEYSMPRPIAEVIKQCFIAGRIHRRRLEAMLDIPKDNEKSFAEGKILQSMTEGVGVVTFNNPEKRNAMSLDMWEGLGQALTELRDNPEVRVVILTG